MAHSITSISGVSTFKDIRNNLTKSKTESYKTRNLSQITSITVHHSAGPSTQTAYDFANYHVNTRGWPGIGYHFVIDANGVVHWTNSLETISYHVGDHNSYTVGVNMIGNFSETKPTTAQLNSMYAVVRYLMSLLNVSANNVKGHKEYAGASTDCPGSNVSMADIRKQLSSSSGGSAVDVSKLVPGSYYDIRIDSGITAERINAHMKGKLAGTGDIFIKSGRDNGIDPAFIAAVSLAEVGRNGNSNFIMSYNNTGGFMKSGGGAMTFGSVRESILYHGDLLKRLYVGAGLYTVEAVHTRYSPVGAANDPENLNSNWVKNVYMFLRELLAGMTVNQNGGSGNSSGSIGGSDGEALMPPQPIMGMAPTVEDDEYPVHRRAGHPWALRIGDSQFYVPPAAIRVEIDSDIDIHFRTMRHKSPTMKSSGFNTRRIIINLVFADVDQINGYPIKGIDGHNYYMDGLRSLLAQARKTPFLPIRNEWLLYSHGITLGTLQEITIETLEGFDNVLTAQLTFLETTVEPYIQYPDEFYDRMIMYPLFRWWYQQLLLEDRKSAYSSTYLRPIENQDMNSELAFRVLDREKLTEVIESVEAQEMGELKLAKMKWADIDKEFFTDWPIGEPVINKVTTQLQRSLKPIRIDNRKKATVQDMGNVMINARFEMYCTREEVEAIIEMVDYMNDLSQDFRRKFVSGFGKIGNEITGLMGMNYFMPSSVKTNAMNEHGAGDIFEVVLELMCFDPTQKNHERVYGVNSVIEGKDYYDTLMSPIIEKKTERKHEIIYETQVEKALEMLELYPDMELPTYDTLNKIIPKINKLRSDNKYQPLPMESYPKPHNAVFVDPDFYIAYPTMESIFSNFQLDEVGEKFINLVTTGTYADIGSQDQEMNFQGILNRMQDQIVDNWQDEEHLNLRSITGNKDIDLTKAGKTTFVPAGQSWNDKTRPATAQDDPQGLASAMCHDMVRYGQTGRLTRAFPTYMMLFVDEGMWMDGKRMWNNYYMYHAISEISVIKDKNVPADLAYVSLSNIYGTFDLSQRLPNPQHVDKPKGIAERFLSYFDDWNAEYTAKQLMERTQLADEIKLNQGARIHLRLGYGSIPGNLPIAFNGHIAEINEGEELTMICQGDGVELVNMALSYDPAANTDNEGLGNESRNVFRSILTRRLSNFWFATSESLNFFNNYESYYGIEHFGVVESNASEGFGKTIMDWGAWISNGWWKSKSDRGDSTGNINGYEVMKNIYRGNPVPSTDEKWLFDGEHNIELTIYNKTAWDIFQTHAAFNPEFICAIHPHGFRSTLFFGMPHWIVKYGYRYKPDINAGAASDRNNANNYVELAKPYQQLHIVSTGSNIIHNAMTASGTQLKHIAVGSYTKGSGQDVATTFAVYADRSIAKHQMKTMLVDTNVSQNYWGPEWLYNTLGMATVGQLLYGVGDALELITSGLSEINDLIGKVYKFELLENIVKKMEAIVASYKKNVDPERIFQNGAVTARDVAIGSLHKQFMEMYQGEIILFGSPEMKPWDLFYLADTHLGLAGTAQVGRIVHSMSASSGFTSNIKPDLCVARSDNLERNALMQVAIFAGIAVSTVLLRKILASNVAKSLMRTTTKGIGKASKKAVVGLGGGKIYQKAEKIPRTMGLAWETMKTSLAEAEKKNGTNTPGNTTTPGSDADKNKDKDKLDLKNKKGLMKSIKTGIRSNLLLGTVLGFLTMQVDKIMKKELAFNNVLYIYPVWKSGRPFTAGVHSAKYIIPNYVDPRYAPEGLNDPNFFKNIPDSTAPATGASSSKVVHPVPDTLGITSAYRTPSRPGHYGIDLAPRGYTSNRTPLATDIRAIADGVVTTNALSTSAGNWVIIRHKIDNKDYCSVYMHLASRSPLKVNQTVKAGDYVGPMGTTGDSTGVHLHIEICEGATRVSGSPGNRIDPKPFFEKYGIKLNVL